MERLLAQHVRHGASEWRERRVLQHLQLEFSVAVDEIGVGEKVHPIVDVDIESAQQALVLKGTALQHFLRFYFS